MNHLDWYIFHHRCYRSDEATKKTNRGAAVVGNNAASCCVACLGSDATGCAGTDVCSEETANTCVAKGADDTTCAAIDADKPKWSTVSKECVATATGDATCDQLFIFVTVGQAIKRVNHMSSRERDDRDERQRQIHISRRGSITIQEPNDFSRYLGSSMKSMKINQNMLKKCEKF